jgi:acyl-CoA synthetase (AMP-forming)/AMP-acid ligase II
LLASRPSIKLDGMPDAQTLVADEPTARLNVADRLTLVAHKMPNTTAVACPRKWSPAYQSVRHGESGATYGTTTFAELDADATRVARGFIAWGVPKGTRLALVVRPGIEFVTLVYALLRAGMVIVLVDPGLGRRNLVRCLAEAEPAGRKDLWRLDLPKLAACGYAESFHGRGGM